MKFGQSDVVFIIFFLVAMVRLAPQFSTCFGHLGAEGVISNHGFSVSSVHKTDTFYRQN